MPKFIKNWITKQFVGSFLDQTAGGFFGGNQSKVNPSNLLENNKNWVYVSTDRIAQTMASVPIRLMRVKSDQEEEVFDHPALELLNKPNQFMTGRNLRYLIAAHKELTGNAYLLKDKEEGSPGWVMPIIPSQVNPKFSKDGMGNWLSR